MGALIWGEIRRRWRGAAAVGIVSGIGFAVAITAAAGARRTESAFPRMLEATAAPQILVSSGDPDEVQRRRFYERIATLEGVKRVGVIAGVGLVPMHVPKGRGTVIESCSSLPVDGIAGYEVYRPNVIEGRLPGVDRTDEILVTDTYAETFGVGVGDELDVVLHAADAIPAAGEATAADGPVVHVTIVGVGVLPNQVVPLSDLDRAPSIVASPAFVGRYAPEQEDQCYDGAVVLSAPGGDVDRVGAEIERVAPPSRDAFIQDLTSNYADVRRAIQPQVTALWLFAAASAGASLLVVTQLLGRQLRQSATTGTAVWRAVGATRSQVRTLIAAPSVVTAVVGSALALAVAVVLSGRFPIGPARLAEPDRGTQLQGWVHLGGAAVVAFIPLLVAGVIAAVARYAPTAPSPWARSGGCRAQRASPRWSSGSTSPPARVAVKLRSRCAAPPSGSPWPSPPPWRP